MSGKVRRTGQVESKAFADDSVCARPNRQLGSWVWRWKKGEARLRAEALGVFQGVPRSRGFILTGTGALEASGRETPRSRCAF